MRLNIIGNGFDLYHGIPSKYQDFANWLIQNDAQLFESIGDYYDVPVFEYERCGLDYETIGYCVNDMFWSAFEDRLGHINELSFEEQLLDDLSLENDDPVSLISTINADSIAEKLKIRFSKWVYETIDKKRNYSLVNKMIGTNKCKLSKSDFYITFNYSHTLQKVYQIPEKNIFYIHGECDGPNSSLIVGHGNKTIIKELTNKIEKLENEYTYCQAERNRIDEKTCERSFLKALEKNVSYNLLNLTLELNRFPDFIDEIYVYGFSFGKVDMPYIKTVYERYPKAKWYISYNKKDNANENRIMNSIRDLTGNTEIDLSFFEFINPNCDFIRKQIL